MASKKVSGLGGIQDSTDDSLVMLSYTEDGGSTFQTKKIRLGDLIDDFNVEDLANVSGTPDDGQVLIYDSSIGQWQPGSQTGGPGSGIEEAPLDGGYYVRHEQEWMAQDLYPFLRYRLDADGGDFDDSFSEGAGLTLDGGDFTLGTSAGEDLTADGGVFT